MKRSGITGNHQNVFCHFHSSFHQNQNNVKRSIHTRQTDLFGQDMLALFQKHELLNPDTLNPFFHSISGSSDLKPLSLHPFHRIRTQCMKVHSAGTNPAAMGGTERNNRLFGKIIAFQKRTDNPGGLPVPYGIANQNGVIAVHILHIAGYTWTRIGIVLSNQFFYNLFL